MLSLLVFFLQIHAHDSQVAGHVTASVKAQSHDSEEEGLFTESVWHSAPAEPGLPLRREGREAVNVGHVLGRRGALCWLRPERVARRASPSRVSRTPPTCLNGTTVFESRGVAGLGRQGGLQGEGMRQGPRKPIASPARLSSALPPPGAPSPVTTPLFAKGGHQSGFQHILPVWKELECQVWGFCYDFRASLAHLQLQKHNFLFLCAHNQASH